MVVLVNRAKMTTSTTGTGTITLGSVVDGYQTFAAAGVSNGDSVRYVIEDGTSNWEIGSGTYTASGTTLSRTPSESSGGGSAINLSGDAIVFISAIASDIQPITYVSTTFTATAGQTAFTVSYTAGLVEVFLNGAKLSAADFTATNGTSIVLASGANVGDTVDVVAYGTVSVSNTYTQAQANALFVDVAGDTMTGNLAYGDNVKATFGASADLQVYHDGSNSYVSDTGTGDIIIKGDMVRLQDSAGGNLLVADANDAVKLYYGYQQKLTTTATGVDITGTAEADLVDATGATTFDPAGSGTDTATDVSIAIPRGKRIVGYNDGYIRTLIDYNTSGTIEIGQNSTTLVGDISLRPGSTGSVILYEGGSTKLETTATGISVTGNITVTGTVDGRDIATNIPASLGTAGQVLSVNAGANAAEWADVASGGTSNGFVYFMRG